MNAVGYEKEVLCCYQVDPLEVKACHWPILNLSKRTFALSLFSKCPMEYLKRSIWDDRLYMVMSEAKQAFKKL